MIYTGVGGWDYPSWKGRVYPERPRSDFDPLRYLSSYLRLLEVNRTYYRPATVHEAQGWLSRVRDRPHLVFSAKLPEKFVAPGGRWSRTDIHEARAGLDFIQDHGRLAAAVLQFAFSFKRTRKDGSVDTDNIDWMHNATDAFTGLPVFVEFRHQSWNVPQVLEDLREHSIGWVNVDQPLLFKGALPLTAHVTTERGYLRMHGRNYKSWGRGVGRQKKSAEALAARQTRTTFERKQQETQKDDRFDYLYSADELHELADTVQHIASTPGVHDVLTVNNNHTLGKGVVNAVMLDAIFGNERVPAPPDLFREFGDVLYDFAFPSPEITEQEELELIWH